MLKSQGLCCGADLPGRTSNVGLRVEARDRVATRVLANGVPELIPAAFIIQDCCLKITLTTASIKSDFEFVSLECQWRTVNDQNAQFQLHNLSWRNRANTRCSIVFGKI